MDRIFCHFGPFFDLLPSTLLTTQKLKSWKNEKNTWKHHPFTDVYQKSQPWCMTSEIGSDRKEFFVIWNIFCPFIFVTTQKIKILKKKRKKHQEISYFTHVYQKSQSLHLCVPQITIISCMIPETWSATDKIFGNFQSFFALLPH